MTPKYRPILWLPKKISTKSSYPKNIHFSENPLKNIEIQNFEPQKKPLAYVCKKINRSTPTPCAIFAQNSTLLSIKKYMQP